MIPLTCNEIRRLLATAVLAHDRANRFHIGWSHWRRRHQGAAELAHYKRRGEQLLHPDHGQSKITHKGLL
jgi:hypothetical protein